MKQNLRNLTIKEMQELAAGLGEKPYRGKQVFQWISRGAESFDEMTDLPKGFRQKLSDAAEIGLLEVLDVQEDPSDGTRKFLFGLPDPAGAASTADPVDMTGGAGESGAATPAGAGLAIESVFMKYSYGNTLCVSSQVGCKMGCAFCASALGGFIRDLTAGEMIAQVMEAERQTGEKIDHIVVMGMGEPFDNYENLSRFLMLLHEPAGRNMSWRHITVSTSGIIPKIEQFGDDFPQVNLAISLHRANDAARSKLMPVNRRYPLKDLLEAARAHTVKTGRRITFEYALIRGENDRPEDINALIRSLRGMLCLVNLIPLNEVKETGLTGSSRKRAEEVAAQLEAAGITATVRRELGSEIDGACGQLRLRRGNCQKNHR